jgi:hypothetical protein
MDTEKRPHSEHTRQWSPKDGVWLAGWMKYQMFWPLLVLLGLNLFWYFLILRIAKRYVAVWTLGRACSLTVYIGRCLTARSKMSARTTRATALKTTRRKSRVGDIGIMCQQCTAG